MNDVTMTLSETLNNLIHKLNISEAALGRAINVPRATINRLVSGKTPDPRASTLLAIAKYFDVTVDQLLGNAPMPDSLSKSRDLASKVTLIPWEELKHLPNINDEGQKVSFISTDLSDATEKFAVRLSGDSMSPLFPEDTILIVDTIKNSKNRDYILVYISESNDIMLRQLIIEGTYKILQPLNNIFPSINLQANDRIIGVVIQTRQDLE
jgi:transcriptional regulator with XRE-family HTH domain